MRFFSYLEFEGVGQVQSLDLLRMKSMLNVNMVWFLGVDLGDGGKGVIGSVIDRE